jgi:helicase
MEMPELRQEIAEISIRVQYGVKAQLIPLVRLKNIGRVRARRLFNAGITNRKDILNTDTAVLVRILGQHLARQLKGGRPGEEQGDGQGSALLPPTADPGDLTALPGIGVKLAGKLRENGILSVNDLLNSDTAVLARIIGSQRAQAVLAALSREEKEADEEREPVRKGQVSISDFL